MLRTVTLLIALSAAALTAAEKPSGRFLFQPMLIWATSETTQQGTGYLVTEGGRTYGVTSIHFMNFEAGGLFEAIWLDIPSSRPVVGFRTSLGKPGRQAINEFPDIAHDFIVMPLDKLPADCTALPVEDIANYPKATKLWFPNKTETEKSGYAWIEAEVVADEKHVLKVRLLSPVKLQSQSGSPFINQETGRVAGMLMGGDEKVIFLCPTRFMARRIKQGPEAVPLMESIRKN